MSGYGWTYVDGNGEEVGSSARFEDSDAAEAWMGDSWRDQEHVKFTEEFEQTLKVIEHFLDIADQHVPFLNRKAERIEEYLQQH